MNIALVHDYIPTLGGAEKVLAALAELYPEAPIYTAYYNPELKLPFDRARLRTGFLQRFGKRASLFNPFLYLYFEDLDLRGYDVIISSGYFSKGLLTRPEQSHINYCHTPPRFLYHLPSSRDWSGWRGILAAPYFDWLRVWDFVSARRPQLIIANSQTVKQRIAKWWRLDATVVYPPVEINPPSGQPSASGDYFLVVSRLEKYKNINLIIKAADQLKLSLKVAGTGALESSLRLQSGPTVEVLGWVDPSKLPELYQNCKAVIIAAQDEDFGIGALEAQAYGKPVIALRSGGLAETVIEGKTGVFFDQTTVESLAGAFHSFGQTTFDSAACRANAEKYSVERFMKEVGELVENATNTN